MGAFRKSLAAGVAVVLAALSVLVGTASAAPEVDQSQTVANDQQPIAGAPAFPAYRTAQTFTAGVTGTLDQIDILLNRQFSPGDLKVEIRSAAAGVPTTSALAAATVPEATLPLNGPVTWVSVVFDAPASVAAGDQYAIVVYAPFGFCGGDCWMWWGAVGDPYAAGAALWALDGLNWIPNEAAVDFAFTTYVTRSLPTGKQQCKDDGWRAFPEFKNQGECMRFVKDG
jgi:hypothetical protein